MCTVDTKNPWRCAPLASFALGDDVPQLYKVPLWRRPYLGPDRDRSTKLYKPATITASIEHTMPQIDLLKVNLDDPQYTPEYLALITGKSW